MSPSRSFARMARTPRTRPIHRPAKRGSLRNKPSNGETWRPSIALPGPLRKPWKRFLWHLRWGLSTEGTVSGTLETREAPR